MKKRFGWNELRRPIYWLVFCMYILGLVEGTAWIGHWILFDERFSYSRVAQLRERVAASVAVHKQLKTTQNIPVKLLHPYYGYIANPIWIQNYRRDNQTKEAGELLIEDPINAYGFFGKTLPIQPRDPGKLVVAICGGSVAAYAAAWGGEVLIQGLRKIQAFKEREVVLLNFGAGGYKQPQQLMVIGDILSQGGHFDLLINIDGFNEIALPRVRGFLSQDVSPYFPQSWKLMTETNFSRDDLVRLGRIALIQEGREKLLIWAGRKPWRYSVTANTVWRVLDSSLSTEKIELEKVLGHNTKPKAAGLVATTADLRTSLGPPHHLKNARDLYKASASLWARSSMLLDSMIRDQGGLYVHVLQPNQYFPGSKPIGPDEAKVALSTKSPFKAEVEMGYPYLRSAGRSLARSHIHFFDLSTLFKNYAKPAYGDNCCHFTREGNAKFVEEIVSRVAIAASERSRSPAAVKFDFSPNTLREFALDATTYRDGSETPLHH